MPPGDDDQIAEEFSNYFIEKIDTIRDSLDDKPLYCPENRAVPDMDFTSLSENELRKIINDLASKSCENDIIPTKILKRYLDDFFPILYELVNKCMHAGLFPDSWKGAIIRPLIKKLGLKLIKSNFRPVSNLVFLSKVLEKAFLLRFTSHCVKYSLLPMFQSAYRPCFSCETALIYLCDNIMGL